MEPSPSDSTVGQPRSSPGLAIASLVLGILGLVLSFLVVGGFLSLIGLLLGVLHLAKKRRPAAMATAGTVLSVLGLLAAFGFTAFYYTAYREFTKMMQSQSNENAVALNDWQGVLAPDFTVTTLDGQRMKLSQLRGKRVVLDFWATWCPPCRKEIPHFIQLFNQTSRNDLVIIGISDEDAATLRSFIAKNGMNYPVASAKNLPPPYSGLQYIPTTFFIDRKGVIQTIAVGYHDYDQIKGDALAPDLSAPPKSTPAAGPASLPNAAQMLAATLAWSTNLPDAQALCVGDWNSAGTPRVLVAAGLTLHVLDLKGDEISTVSLPKSYGVIECGQNKTNGPRLLGYNNWEHSVDVMDATGKKLWSIPSTMGVDGAHWGDLNGDGNDEVIAGMNGLGGLQAWSADGKKLWSVSLGNVWNQAVIPAAGEQPGRVLATDAAGSVHIYDAKGNSLATLRPDGGYYAQMAACRMPDNSIQIAAITGHTSVVFDDSGKVLWKTSSIGGETGLWAASFAAGDLTGDGDPDWAFIDGSGALVIATPNGQKLSQVPASRHVSAFAIAPVPGHPGYLIVLDGGSVMAYTFAP
jgi:peroxiredoxin/outer membrane protein assembly factor BamB